MAFFLNQCFLRSFFIACLAVANTLPICSAQEPDRVLPRLILENKPAGKVRLLYGHGASVSHKITDLPRQWKKGIYGEPYFIKTANLSDAALYEKVKTPQTHLSIPFMRIKAFMLWHGRGAERNTALAVHLWKTAAKAGDETSTDLLSRLPRTSKEALYKKRYLSLKRNRLQLPWGRELFMPRIYFTPRSKVRMIQLKKNENVSAFLQRAVDLWQKGDQVNILLAPED